MPDRCAVTQRPPKGKRGGIFYGIKSRGIIALIMRGGEREMGDGGGSGMMAVGGRGIATTKSG